MLKKIKVLLSIFLVILITAFSSGCSAMTETVESFTTKTPYFAFSNGKLFDDSREVFYRSDDVESLECSYSSYRSNLHYEKLSDNEKIVYSAVEYALENCYTNILVESPLLNNEDELSKVIEFLSLDSPLLEQNLIYEYGTCTTARIIEVFGIPVGDVAFDGYYLSVENFASEYWDKKMQALEKAKNIAEKFDDNLSDDKKAEKIFRYFGKNYEYENYNDYGKVNPYLYDVLINKKGQCDGFANAYALICNIKGLECAEKMDDSSRLENDEEGHTWNWIKLKGKWYNIDVTGALDDLPKEGTAVGGGIYFAFADDILEYATLYDEVYEDCKDGLYIDLYKTANEYDYATLTKYLVRSCEDNNKKWGLAAIKKCREFEVEFSLRGVANTLQISFNWFLIELYDGSWAVYICNEDLY